MRDRRINIGFLYLNVGHVYTHLFMLLYPTVVLVLGPEFGATYGARLALAVFGFVAFGAGALPAGWLGDRWSRRGMMVVFFVGIGAATLATGLATTPFQIATGLTFVGLFASIYHPIGIALVSENAASVGRDLGINGVFGNIGVAMAALTAGVLIDLISWRAAFIVPGAIAIATGIAYALTPAGGAKAPGGTRTAADGARVSSDQARVFTILIVATIAGGVIFNGTTISMPKLFDLRLAGLVSSTSGMTSLVAVVFIAAAFSQVVVGLLIDRFPLRNVLLGVAIVQLPFMALAAVAGGGWTLVTAILLMMAVFGTIPINDTIVARYVAVEWRSRAYAAKYFLSFGISASVVPMISWFHDATGGFTSLFFTLTGFALVTLVAAAMFPGTKRVAMAV